MHFLFAPNTSSRSRQNCASCSESPKMRSDNLQRVMGGAWCVGSADVRLSFTTMPHTAARWWSGDHEQPGQLSRVGRLRGCWTATGSWLTNVGHMDRIVP